MTYEVIDKLKARALAGDADTQIRLANRYVHGFTVVKDVEGGMEVRPE